MDPRKNYGSNYQSQKNSASSVSPKSKVLSHSCSKLTRRLQKIQSECSSASMEWETVATNIIVQKVVEVRQYITPSKPTRVVPVSSQIQSPCSQCKMLVLVIDTNVFLSAIEFLSRVRDKYTEEYGYPILYIPWQVVQELDSIKDRCTGNRPLRFRVTKAIQFIEDNLCPAHDRVKFQDQVSMRESKNTLEHSSPDDRILAGGLQIADKLKQLPNVEPYVVLISEDVNLRNKALICHLQSRSVSDIEEIVFKGRPLLPCTSVINEPVRKRFSKVEDLFCRTKSLLFDHMSQLLVKAIKIKVSGMTGTPQWEKFVLHKPPWDWAKVFENYNHHQISLAELLSVDTQFLRPILRALKTVILQHEKDGVVTEAIIQGLTRNALALAKIISDPIGKSLQTGIRGLEHRLNENDDSSSLSCLNSPEAKRCSSSAPAHELRTSSSSLAQDRIPNSIPSIQRKRHGSGVLSLEEVAPSTLEKRPRLNHSLQESSSSCPPRNLASSSTTGEEKGPKLNLFSKRKGKRTQKRLTSNSTTSPTLSNSVQGRLSKARLASNPSKELHSFNIEKTSSFNKLETKAGNAQCNFRSNSTQCSSSFISTKNLGKNVDLRCSINSGSNPNINPALRSNINPSPSSSSNPGPSPSSNSDPSTILGPSSSINPGPRPSCNHGPSSSINSDPSTSTILGRSSSINSDPSSSINPGPSISCNAGPCFSRDISTYSTTDAPDFISKPTNSSHTELPDRAKEESGIPEHILATFHSMDKEILVAAIQQTYSSLNTLFLNLDQMRKCVYKILEVETNEDLTNIPAITTHELQSFNKWMLLSSRLDSCLKRIFTNTEYPDRLTSDSAYLQQLFFILTSNMENQLTREQLLLALQNAWFFDTLKGGIKQFSTLYEQYYFLSPIVRTYLSINRP